MTGTLQQVRTAVEEAQEDLRDSWGADSVDVHGQGYTLSWDEEEEKTVDNVHKMVEEMRSLSEANPDAEINGQADTEGFRVSAWYPENNDEYTTEN